MISGGTGAGKTTLLNVLSGYIPEDERIVTIEDAAELRLRQKHVARMETRPANIEGNGAIKIRDLVINALRMRPDRIIVGEVRGEEALDMLQAMNTGHDGSLTTIHANTPRDAVGRLEVMVGMANANMGVRSIRQQISSAVDLIVQVARFSDGTRRITHITECVGMEGEHVTMQDIFLFEKTGVNEKGRVGTIPRHRHPPEVLRARACRWPAYPAASSIPDHSGDRVKNMGLLLFCVLLHLGGDSGCLCSSDLQSSRSSANSRSPDAAHRVWHGRRPGESGHPDQTVRIRRIFSTGWSPVWISRTAFNRRFCRPAWIGMWPISLSE